MTLTQHWETDRANFEQITKDALDAHARAGDFVRGPLQTDLSRWAKEFGPYDPERWAFGELKDGRLVCAKTQG